MPNAIRELPQEQRPYEKCLQKGASSLTDSELLAVILKTGTTGCNSIDIAAEILRTTEQSSYPGLAGILHLSVKDLMTIHGIGPVKAVQLKCIGELSKRIATSVAKTQLCLSQPQTIARYYMEQLRHEETERILCMMMDTHMHLLGESVLSSGTVNASLITPREVFIEALRYHAVNLILVHNHPSGSPVPSSDDLMITEKIYYAGEMIGIHLTDHIIIGDQKYISFREQGIFKGYQDHSAV